MQIAAAALWLKARRICPEARPERLNLVAANLRLASLADDDPALAQLRREVERETGIPVALTDTVIHALKGADHLGSLLRVDAAVEEALDRHEAALGRQVPTQLGLLGEADAPGAPPAAPAGPERREALTREQARAGILERLERFLARHTGGDDLGLRLRGEQLAAGVRFVRMLREGTYDLVVGNPPYQGTAKMQDAGYVRRHYPRGKADLYAAFLERGLQLARDGGTSALLTMRNWMFIKQYAELRGWLLETFDLRALGDVSWGAFEEMRDNPVVMSIVRRCFPAGDDSIALAPTDPQERVRTLEELQRKRAGLLCQVGRYEFRPDALKVVPEWPVVYWWSDRLLARYKSGQKVSDSCPARFGLTTGDNARFLRRPYELYPPEVFLSRVVENSLTDPHVGKWVPTIQGAKGIAWFEPAQLVIGWESAGLEHGVFAAESAGANVRNPEWYFKAGIAFSMIGSTFTARAHRYKSVFGSMGSSLFPDSISKTLCSLNSRTAHEVMLSLNPGVHFEVGDVNRLPVLEVESADSIFRTMEVAFSRAESHREPSVEFKHPGPSPWRHAQDWAQAAVDRPEGAPLPPYAPEYDPEPPTDHLSFALGVALGRFGPKGEGILDPASDDLSHALPAGILFLDGTLDAGDEGDGLGHPAARVLREAWDRHGAAVDPGGDLRTWLRLKCFGDVHRGMYENRPIHWPLSSDKRTFCAWVTIHRWDERTLRILQADHLNPALLRIDGELDDLRAARDGADRKAARDAERRLDKVRRWRDELAAFIAAVAECAEKGPPPTDAKCPPRELDARYAPDLDDGVMINSAALWPLLAPQWKDPA